MKHALLVLAVLPLSILSSAQSSDGQDHIKLTAANDSLNIQLKNQSFKLKNIQELDSCLKNNLPGTTVPVIDLEAYSSLTPQNHRAIIVIMDKYRIPVASERTLPSGKGKPAVSLRKAVDEH